MSLSKEIKDLIDGEQIRQNGNFLSDSDNYLNKITKKAELLMHNSAGECLGFVFFYCNDPGKFFSYITLIMVAHNSRKMGIGSALVQYVLNQTAQRGFKVCRLEVRKENAIAFDFYQTMGFLKIEDRIDSYLMEARVN